MDPRRLAWLSLAAAAACSEGVTTRPTDSTLAPPSFVISDGSRCTSAFPIPCTSNPDFFFLPPMVPDPTGSPNFQAADFNPNLIPLVKVCAFASTVTTEAQVTGGATARCTNPTAAFGAAADPVKQMCQGTS